MASNAWRLAEKEEWGSAERDSRVAHSEKSTAESSKIARASKKEPQSLPNQTLPT